MIVCLGTTPTMQRTMTFARLELDHVNRANSVHEHASGKSVNVARVLHDLGNESLAMGFLGGDRAAPFLADLDRSGIRHDFLKVEAPTRLCTTIIDESSGVVTELVEESYPVKPSDYEALLYRLSDELKDAELLVLSGSLPPGASTDFYARCMEMAQGKVRVVLDAVGEALLKGLEYKPLVVKPNQSELGRTLGIEIKSDDALRQAMTQLVERGATWAIVTRGRADTMVTNGRSFWKVKTPSVKALSPIGSGDSFAAGLAMGIIKNESIPQACVLAAACGAANAMTAYSGILHPEDVARLVSQVVLEECP